MAFSNDGQVRSRHLELVKAAAQAVQATDLSVDQLRLLRQGLRNLALPEDSQAESDRDILVGWLSLLITKARHPSSPNSTERGKGVASDGRWHHAG